MHSPFILAFIFMQAQQPSGDVHATRALSRMPSFGKSLSRSLSRGSGSSSSGSTMERAASAAAAIGGQPSSSGQGGMLGMAVGVWRKAASKLFDLEAKIANQVLTNNTMCSERMHKYSHSMLVVVCACSCMIMLLTASMFCEICIKFMAPVVNCMTQTCKECPHTHPAVMSSIWCTTPTDTWVCGAVSSSSDPDSSRTAAAVPGGYWAGVCQTCGEGTERPCQDDGKLQSHDQHGQPLHKLPCFLAPNLHRFPCAEWAKLICA